MKRHCCPTYLIVQVSGSEEIWEAMLVRIYPISSSKIPPLTPSQVNSLTRKEQLSWIAGVLGGALLQPAPEVFLAFFFKNF